MLPRPTIGTDSAKLFELSSIFQPVMSTAAPPTGVAPLTREAFRASRGLLDAMASRNEGLREVAAALCSLVRADTPDPKAVELLEALFDDIAGVEG